MARGGSAFLAIVNSVRLQDIVERQAARDALGADSQRTRGEDFDLAVAESRTSAIIFDRREITRILQKLGAALVRAMLESGEHGDVRDALADGRMGPGHTADLPQAGLRLGETGWLLGSCQSQRGSGQ